MIQAPPSRPGSRLDRERSPLITAFLISILLHLLLAGGLELAFQAGLLSSSPTRTLIEQVLSLPQETKPADRARAEMEQQIPLMFVEVDPSRAAETAPRDAQFYSSQSTRAANPNPQPISNAPRIEGTQEKVVKTFDTLKPDPKPPVPATVASTPVESLSPVPEARPKPKVVVEQGNLEFSKPSPKLITETGDAESKAESRQPQIRERPRRLADARQRKGIIEGNAMKQHGGVAQHSDVALLDVAGRSFGAYDAAVVAAIQRRWYDLLEDRNYALERSGRVVLEFRLLQDGRISDMKVLDNNVGDFWGLICQKAIEDPAPYAKWPASMRREIGKDYREVRFTFHYN